MQRLIGKYRLSLRPVEGNSDVFNFTILGFEGKDYTSLLNSDEALIQALHEMSGLSEESVGFGDVVWSGIYSPHIRMVDRFQIGRILVAGGKLMITSIDLLDRCCLDAAHVHSPTGGQGLNSGFSDAVNVVPLLELPAKTDSFPR